MLWKVRAKCIDATWRHAGDGCVVSSTYAVGNDCRTAVSGSTDVPVFRILPDWYMAALPPSTAAPPMGVHVRVPRLKIWLAVGSSAVDDTSSRPSASTNTWG